MLTDSMGHAGCRGLRPGKSALPLVRRGGTTMPTIALRMAGFADCIDSTTMMLKWLGEMERTKALPPMLVPEALAQWRRTQRRCVILF